MSEIQKPLNLKGRHFLKEDDFTKKEFSDLIDFAITLKDYKKNGIPHRYLDHKNIALLFEKTSTRTRAAFTVASIDLGAHPEFLGKNDIQLGKKETVEDTAKVLGRMFDGIEFRGFSQQVVEDLAKYSGVPVWNGLTDAWHPTQMLADYMTVKENFGHLDHIKLTYVGDGRNNVANSLLVAGPMLGVDVTICSPKELFPSQDYVDIAERRAKQDGGSVTITDNIDEGVKDADVIYTDVWVSMGEESEFENRINLLKDYQVNQELFDKTGKKDTIFLHCLPAFHDTNTVYGQQIEKEFGLTEMEVTDEIFRSEHSKVFDQAENRMHTIKAVMAATLG
ncbi:ornithine carbamoyltransferase [Staphylococcus auricularis]|uniref:Ornithine carbamoyltransferase n=1 Tax=Staphylococcus auricularis TaxID=29379 RepID=A0AAP8TU61_9STAP|nr:ornithine carbamoyltransferase [Staphylococcus auricularis]MCG7340659.1 ornithine carbamoyltransferase [Staphylococcus auricularis]MDC6326612.1 ornithine carbamoyltransferase [Staphylococcus auricularis]MDN4532489.1 ornithine carbamoyltransferase [Staphylococcus auricularis]PNZ69616.1 ornithine carbamoyltransferase [Staphylococcus auricularis]QPT05392.1 ornithine carbamoyltransferase [Staphylococcus auricularis]